MPLHDWTRVDAGLFHAFHHRWIDALCDSLNGGILPSDYFALPEQRIRGPIPDVLTLKLAPSTEEQPSAGGLAVATAPPKTRTIRRGESECYARGANRIAVRHRHGEVVSVIEIVSPGNKSSPAEVRAFVRKSADLLCQGVHLLVIDVFPPGKHDPKGIPEAIWDECGEPDAQETSARQSVASFDAGPPRVMYAEPVIVGERLPEVPLFLRPELYVPAPLDSTYETTWKVFPAALKKLLQ